MSSMAGIISIVIILAGSITLHEFMHAFISYRLGDDTAKYSGRLSLNPLAHIDPFATVLLPIFLYLAGLPIFGAAKPVPFNPYRLRGGAKGAALVSIAGPLTNLVIAFLLAGIVRVVPVDSFLSSFLTLAVVVNIGFFVFNLIPFPPLDGSRVLYAFAPESLRQVMQRIEGFGLIGIALFIFVLFPVISPLFGTIINAILNRLIPGFSF